MKEIIKDADLELGNIEIDFKIMVEGIGERVIKVQVSKDGYLLILPDSCGPYISPRELAILNKIANHPLVSMVSKAVTVQTSKK